MPNKVIVPGSGTAVTPCSPSATPRPENGVPVKPVFGSKLNGVVLKDIPGQDGLVPPAIAKLSPRLNVGIEFRYVLRSTRL